MAKAPAIQVFTNPNGQRVAIDPDGFWKEYDEATGKFGRLFAKAPVIINPAPAGTVPPAAPAPAPAAAAPPPPPVPPVAPAQPAAAAPVPPVATPAAQTRRTWLKARRLSISLGILASAATLLFFAYNGAIYLFAKTPVNTEVTSLKSDLEKAQAEKGQVAKERDDAVTAAAKAKQDSDAAVAAAEQKAKEALEKASAAQQEAAKANPPAPAAVVPPPAPVVAKAPFCARLPDGRCELQMGLVLPPGGPQSGTEECDKECRAAVATRVCGEDTSTWPHFSSTSTEKVEQEAEEACPNKMPAKAPVVIVHRLSAAEQASLDEMAKEALGRR